MHVVLINPPQGVATGRKPNIDNRPYLFPPGILFLAGTCEQAGHETEIIDFPLKGWILKDFENWLEKTKPAVIGISCCSPSLPYVKSIAKTIRRLSPETRIIAGGPHVTFSPSGLIEEGVVDYAVRYEGELVLLSLLEEIQNKKKMISTPGVTYRSGETIVHNQEREFIRNLDDLALPAYHLINMEKYRTVLNRIAMNTMRGCPFKCKFCTISKLMGEEARVRSPEKVVEEIHLLTNTYKIRRISFTDPNFALFPERLVRLKELFDTDNIKIEFGCQSRIFTLTDEVLDTLKSMGCVAIFVGIESGSEKILDSYCKNIEQKSQIDILKTIGRVKDREIDVIPSFIIGSPEEHLEDVQATLNLARRIIDKFDLRQQQAGAGGNFQINMFGPFPGSLKSSLLLELPIEFAPALPVCGTYHLSRTEIKSLWHGLYKEFFPNFYDKYKAIEDAAEKGRNLYYEAFLENSSQVH